jgi:hypothetical protein
LRAIERIATPAILCAVLGAIVIGIVSYFQSVRRHENSAAAFVAEAMSAGHRVPARVTHQQFYREGNEDLLPIQRYLFEYSSADGRARPPIQITETEGHPFECCLLFNSEKLRQDVRPNDDLNVAKTFYVTIAYLEGDYTRVALPDYPPAVVRVPFWTVALGLIPLLMGMGLYGIITLGLVLKVSELLVVRRQE